MEYINRYLSGALVPISLAAVAIYYLIKLGMAPIRYPIVSLRAIFFGGDGAGTSSVRAVMVALAGTLGVGNIVGVATAISLGGPGAVFWMWVSAALAMILKYSEVVLAVLHRRKRGAEHHGGAMYYMKDHFSGLGHPRLGYIFCLVFTVFCLMNGASMGCMIQSNAIARSFEGTFGISRYICGAVVAFLSFVVFILNGKKIFSVCEKLVPLVSVLYIFMSLYVMIVGREGLEAVLADIFEGAFSLGSAGAGALGFFSSRALRYGTIRGLFSNEAGCGTSPIAHATADTDSPVRQGLFGIVEVFIDTVVVCTMTAFVILLHKDAALAHASDPIMMAMSAFSSVFGHPGEVLLSISVFLFAFATVICWGYYGRECIYFISASRRAERWYYLVYVMLAFFGAFVPLGGVWELADLAVGVMTLMNLAVLCGMSGEVREVTMLYYKNKRSFRRSSL